MTRVHRFVSNDFTVRAAAVDATEVVRKMQILQETYPLPTVAVGRAMIGALLLASHQKEGQEVGILIKGYGPMSNVYAQASFEGKVRGYTPHTFFEPQNYETGLSLKNAVGPGGTLTVVRHQPFQKQPHQGTVALQSGEIGDDIAYYLEQSHQIRSLISLGVYLDGYGKVLSAGGVLIEVMPGVEDELIEKIEKNSQNLSTNISQALHAGQKPVEFILPFFEGISITELPHEYPLEYHCPCTAERVMGALTILGEQDLEDMIQKQESADVTCQMCGRNYSIPVDELVVIRDRLRKDSMH